jgi:hypothetical protein
MIGQSCLQIAAALGNLLVVEALLKRKYMHKQINLLLFVPRHIQLLTSPRRGLSMGPQKYVVLQTRERGATASGRHRPAFRSPEQRA